MAENINCISAHNKCNTFKEVYKIYYKQVIFVPNKNEKGFIDDSDYNTDLKATIENIEEGRKKDLKKKVSKK